MKKLNSFQIGLSGESIAIGHLQLNGYQILETRYKTIDGEIDIIAINKNMLVCIEVKVRKTIEDALYAISQRQQQRIMQTYFHYIQIFPKLQELAVRFDVIVCAPGTTPEHIQNAFGEL